MSPGKGNEVTLKGRAQRPTQTRTKPAKSVAPETLAGAGWTLRNALPFAAVLILGEFTALLQNGTNNDAALAISTALLFLAVLAGWLAATRKLGLEFLPPLIYVGSIAFLLVADGGVNSGLVPLVLVPIVWSALYGDLLSAGLVLVAAVITVVWISIFSQSSVATDIRRLVIWGAMGTIIVLSIRRLRIRLDHALQVSRERLRQSELLSVAARNLNGLNDRQELVDVATHIATEFVLPYDPSSRAAYLRIQNGVVRATTEIDPLGVRMTPFPLRENGFLSEVVRTRRPQYGTVSSWRMGPQAMAILQQAGIAAEMAVPIAPRNHFDGILSVATRSHPPPTDIFHRVVALGEILELALSNTMSIEELSHDATTDALTGLGNRRELQEMISHRGRSGFAFVSADIDNLKQVNDTLGHKAGDRLIIKVAHALHDSLRAGEVLARTGGDEFVVFLLGASLKDANAAANRMLAAVLATGNKGPKPSISIGVAAADPEGDPEVTLHRADTAMYRAKREGGSRVYVNTPQGRVQTSRVD